MAIKKEMWIVSSLEQKQHCLLPFQFRLARLSLVRIAPLFKYHINILILRGTFSFQRCLSNCTLPLLISTLYIELMVNILDWFKFHWKKSALSFKWTWLMRATKSCHKLRLWPIKDRQNDTLRGTWSKTDATVACFFRTILKRVEYCSLSVWLPNHLSSQKWILLPSFKWKDPKFRKVSLTFTRPVKNESPPVSFVLEKLSRSLSTSFLIDSAEYPLH